MKNALDSITSRQTNLFFFPRSSLKLYKQNDVQDGEKQDGTNLHSPEVHSVRDNMEDVLGGVLGVGDGGADDDGGGEHVIGEDGVVEERGVLQRRRRRYWVGELVGQRDPLGGEADGETVERLGYGFGEAKAPRFLARASSSFCAKIASLRRWILSCGSNT